MRKAECGLNKEHSGAVHLPGKGLPRALLGGPWLLNESRQCGASSDKQHTS